MAKAKKIVLIISGVIGLLLLVGIVLLTVLPEEVEKDNRREVYVGVFFLDESYGWKCVWKDGEGTTLNLTLPAYRKGEIFYYKYFYADTDEQITDLSVLGERIVTGEELFFEEEEFGVKQTTVEYTAVKCKYTLIINRTDTRPVATGKFFMDYYGEEYDITNSWRGYCNYTGESLYDKMPVLRIYDGETLLGEYKHIEEVYFIEGGEKIRKSGVEDIKEKGEYEIVYTVDRYDLPTEYQHKYKDIVFRLGVIVWD